jgi:NAD(P)-dependent dehydrogenase (short-subunit alcohol dehydrogenase family)
MTVGGVLPEREGQVAVVTGAGQGLGRACARLLADHGWSVVIAERAAEKGRRVEAELRDAGRSALFVETDVSQEESCLRMVERTVDEFGRIDGLVNNAALVSEIAIKQCWELTVDEWDSLMAVNLKGTWLASKTCIDALKEQDGAIVNFASGVAFLGTPGYAHYVASKAGVIGLTRAMATELGPLGVRVNAVSPGPIRTEIERTGWKEDAIPRFLEQQCLKRESRPIDLARVVHFLLSEASSFMTGQTVVVDGGMTFH